MDSADKALAIYQEIGRDANSNYSLGCPLSSRWSSFVTSGEGADVLQAQDSGGDKIYGDQICISSNELGESSLLSAERGMKTPSEVCSDVNEII